MQKYGLIGYPLGHSFSPQIHKVIYELNGIDASYSLQEISPENFNESTFKSIAKNYNGFNVTIPYKSEVMQYLDEISEEAQQIGAVNTLKKLNDKWIGYNTDIDGFLYPLKNYYQKVETCLLIGTGGVAKAAIYALHKSVKPKQLILLGRANEKAELLKEAFTGINNSVELISNAISNINYYLNSVDLVVNATSVGMHPNVDDTILPKKIILRKKAIVYDLVYNPLETKLIKQAKDTCPDCIVINGLQMLIAQAVKAVEIWTGETISVKNTIDALDISKLLL
jgi:shikimate dehydrogenase